MMFWILVFMIAVATIALLIPAEAPQPRRSAPPSGGAIVLPDVRG